MQSVYIYLILFDLHHILERKRKQSLFLLFYAGEHCSSEMVMCLAQGHDPVKLQTGLLGYDLLKHFATAENWKQN